MAKTLSSTVDKALTLLRYFSPQHPEFGLSELARKAGYDKTTTLRCLNSLENNGFVEQDPVTRKFRLGLAPINLARIREQSFPVQTVLQPLLDGVANDTRETGHITLASGSSLFTAMISEPDRALRVYVDPAAQLPFHATASGIAIAAFSSDEVKNQMITETKLEPFTDATPTSKKALNEHLSLARTNGFARSMQTYEEGVIGTAFPIFGPAGVATGAIAIAAVASRFDTALEQKIEQGLKQAALAITHAFGGVIPANPAAAQTT